MIVYITRRQLSNQFCSWQTKNPVASEDPNEDLIATPSICLYNMFLNTKHSLVTKDRGSLNLLFSNHEQCCF